MPVILVMPCLNEEETLLETCISLGFANPSVEGYQKNTLLVMVDNNSTDQTLLLQREIQKLSLNETVFLSNETKRGYIPARHKGNLVARELCIQYQWDESQTLILQVDADTKYLPGYIEAMYTAFLLMKGNRILQGLSEYPPEFMEKYHEFIQLCNLADAPFEKLSSKLFVDVVLDDKVTGYSLKNYFEWGCHQEECTALGDEIYAETTRLAMRAISRTAQVFRVEQAIAHHSTRKILKNPGLEIASSGFPRETAWKVKWLTQHAQVEDIDHYNLKDSGLQTRAAILSRIQLNLALFILLPYHISIIMEQEIPSELDKLISDFHLYLPRRGLSELQKYPGILIEDVFSITDSLDMNQTEQILDWIKSH